MFTYNRNTRPSIYYLGLRLDVYTCDASAARSPDQGKLLVHSKLQRGGKEPARSGATLTTDLALSRVSRGASEPDSLTYVSPRT